MDKKNARWVEVKVMNKEQSLEIIKFLSGIANCTIVPRFPRQFTSDDLVAFNTKLLNYKSSIRFLRDLRLRGLISYEVVNKRQGIYELHSTYTEILRAKAYLEQGGYWINEKSPVFVGERSGVAIEQVGLF